MTKEQPNMIDVLGVLGETELTKEPANIKAKKQKVIDVILQFLWISRRWKNVVNSCDVSYRQYDINALMQKLSSERLLLYNQKF